MFSVEIRATSFWEAVSLEAHQISVFSLKIIDWGGEKPKP